MNTDHNSAIAVIIVDDEDPVLLSLSSVLKSVGINNIICLNDSRVALETVSKQESSVLLLDLTMPYLSGEDLLPQIRKGYPDLPIIIVTGNTEVNTAVECMKAGAFDYLVKPVESSKLIATVKRAIEIQELKRENETLKRHLFSNELENPEAFSDIITNNKKMQSLLLYIEAIAGTAQTVLITGETGVGKELIAQSIHTLSGLEGNLIAVDVAGFDDNMFADTLFGHKKGAFTGADQPRKGIIESSSNGTLFLDEIGDLNHTSQLKLLRLLENHEYFPLGSDIPKRSAARIVVATNKDLNKAIDSGTFRRDLYYRLRTHHVHLPPLRDRIEDLPFLIEHFLEEISKEIGMKKPTAPPELFILLQNYNFPGNIRELKSMIYDGVSRLRHPAYQSTDRKPHKSGFLSLNSFKKIIGDKHSSPSDKILSEALVSFSNRLPTIKQAIELLIAEALERSKGRQTIAAQMLGITQQALSKRLKRSKE